MKKLFLSLLLMISACSIYGDPLYPNPIWSDTYVPDAITVSFAKYNDQGEKYFENITFTYHFDRYIYANPDYNHIIIHMPHNNYVPIEYFGLFSLSDIREHVDAIAQINRDWYLSNYTNFPTYPTSEEETE